MRIYTIQNGTVTIGATVTTHTLSSGAKIPVLSIGESGRGRKLAYLVVDLLPTSQKQWAETGKVDIQFAKTGQTKAGATKLIQTAADSNPEEVLAVFRTHIGFRGSNSHRGDYDGQPFECEHPKAANCLAFPGVVLAEGTIAQGAAGNMGSGQQLIATLKLGDIVRTGYGGRLYGAPSHHFYRMTAEGIDVATWEERTATDCF